MGIKVKGSGAVIGGGGGSKSGGAKVAWEDATEEPRRCVLMHLYGETNCGKTSLALTAPGPIALIHAAEKIDGIVQKQIALGKDIRLYDFSGIYGGTAEEIAAEASASFRALKAAIEDSWGWARTVVIDTHTEMWELIRLARFGKLSQVMPHHYGPVNAEWLGIFKAFRRQANTNLIIIGHMRERYRNDKPTGIMEPAGQKQMSYLADVILKMGRNKQLDFTGLMEKAWWNATIEGLELENEMLDFATVMGLVTEEDPEEWLV
jgi:hypothetical protein